MSFSTDKLYSLLPAIYRIRDVEHGGVLRELIACIAEQVNAIEEDIEQLYDDLFIETCAPWVIPYLGDLVGYRDAIGTSPSIATSREQVANLINFRRRKGTADALEDIAAATLNRAVVVTEFFRRLAITQNINHLRRTRPATPDLRDIDTLVWRNSPFDLLPRTVEVGHPSSGRGRYNIPNLGVFVWRVEAFSMREATPFRVDERRFLFNPLGANTPLFMNPEPETAGAVIEERTSVPQPVPRSAAFLAPEFFYGVERSYWVERGGAVVPIASVSICDLSDTGSDPQTSAWGNMPSSGIAVDPELGRLAFSADVDVAATPVSVSYYYGFHSRIGGGEYNRSESIAPAQAEQVPGTHATISGALTAVNGDGVVEISGSGRYEETLSITAGDDGAIEVRAADRSRPTVVLSGDLVITGGSSSTVTLNGLTILGGAVRVPAAAGGLQKLTLIDCTLVPGLSLLRTGEAAHPGEASLVIEAADLEVEIERCILGPVQAHTDAIVSVTESIVDAGSRTAAAYAGTGGSPGAPLSVEASTVIGTCGTLRLETGSNSIFLGTLRSEHVQKGCLRYSYVRPGSRGPRRYQCQPASAEADGAVRPRFVSLRYGRPGYAQLERLCCALIRQGAEDGGEMGVGHALFEAARERALLRTFEEFVPLGMEAGVFSAGKLGASQ